MCILFLLVGDAVASKAFAQWSATPWDGIDWYVGSHPKGKYVGDCVGNCGAGCGKFMNVCGGPKQYWSLHILDKWVTASGTYIEERCEGDSFPRLYETSWWEYDALAEFHYNGYVTSGCWDHDIICGALYDPSCVAWDGCGSSTCNGCGRRVWAYQLWIWGIKYYRESIGWGSQATC
jgi:hypothetical protein